MLFKTSKTTTHPIIVAILEPFQDDKVYLFPLRLFIGIGWLRAGAEKWLEPTWTNGTKLSTFLTSYVAEDMIAFPFYKSLVVNLFEPSSLSLSYIIMIGQLLVGIAIITGTLTNLALLAGIFMNLNFILIGETVPSTFYVIIQLVLLISHAGYTFGLDRLLGKKVKFYFFVAKAPDKSYSRGEKALITGTIISLFVGALSIVPHIESFSPSSVHDPVMVLFILAIFAAAFFFLTLVHASINKSESVK